MSRASVWHIKQQVLARWSDDNWYTAVIESISPDGSQFYVVFPEYGNSDVVTADRLQPMPTAPVVANVGNSAPSALPIFAIGDIVEACWNEDNNWYPAQIEAVSKDGLKWQVVFLEYDNRDVVTIDRLRKVPGVNPAAPIVSSMSSLSISPATVPPFNYGENVEACWTEDNQWYPARIDAVSKDGNHFKVTFPEYNNSDIVTLDRLRRVTPLPQPTVLQPPAQQQQQWRRWQVGDICEGQFSEDNVWYKARIDAVNPDGSYQVTYIEYGNSEQSSDEFLRPLPSSLAVAQPKFRVGEAVMAQYSEDGIWYKAVIMSILPDGRHYRVLYTEHGNEEDLPEQAIKIVDKVAVPVVSSFKLGEAVEAQWTEDDVWYPALIEAISKDRQHYKVLFTEYGNTDVVTIDRLRPSSAPVLLQPTWKAGDVCEAKFTEDDVWYTARINAIKGADKVNVTYSEYGNSEDLPLSRLRPIQVAKTNGAEKQKPTWKAGDVCEGQFTEDDIWYPARIDAVKDNLAKVTYTEYGNSETIPFSRLRPAKKETAQVWKVGDVCEGKFTEDDIWYKARIDQVKGGIVSVTYLEYGNKEDLPVTRLRPLSSPQTPAQPKKETHHIQWQEGQLCEAQFTEDDQWYLATIDQVRDGGRTVRVTFTDYGNTEDLPASRLRPYAKAVAEGRDLLQPVPKPISGSLMGTVLQQVDSFVAKFTGQTTKTKSDESQFLEPPVETEISPDRHTRHKDRKTAEELFGPMPASNQRGMFSEIADHLPAVTAPPTPANHLASDLPITEHMHKIMQTIERNQVTIISGSTGSGKTTQVPQYILDAYGKLGRKCDIICTQPRRIAAISIAKRVCDERKIELGGLVGYQVSMDKQASSEETRLLYCTTGILLQRLIKTKTLKPFTHVLIDEVHERDTDTDFVVLIVRELLRVEKTVRVVLMSATIDCDVFSKYFSDIGIDRFDHAVMSPYVPVVNVEGRLYNVKIHYLDKIDGGRFLYALPPHALAGQLMTNPEIKPEMYEAACELILRICDGEFASDHERNTNKLGAVLVFLPGLGEIQELYDLIDERVQDEKKRKLLMVIPLHSTLNNEDQQKVFRATEPGIRKIIIATNIAESSITVPDVRYVVDFCLVKEIYCDSNTKLEGLKMQWASKASCLQRSGRAGRVQDGHCFRLIPSRFFEHEMNSQVTPEIQRTSLDHLILQIKVLSVGNPRDVLRLAMQPPNVANIDESLTVLQEAGALSAEPTGNVMSFTREMVYDETGRITRLGQIYAALPVDIRIARLIVFGIAFDLPHEALIMAACLSVTGAGVFSRPFQKDYEFFKKKLQWAAGTWSDAIAAMRAFETWKFLKRTGRLGQHRDERDWARKQFLNLQKIREAEDIMRDLTNRLDGVGISLPEKSNEESKYWNAMQSNRNGEINIDLLFRRDEADVAMLKFLLCAAFYPNFLLSTPNDKHDMEYAKESGFANSLSYDPWRTIILRSSVSFPQGIENHIRSYFNLYCGRVENIRAEGAKCFVTFEALKDANGKPQTFSRDVNGKIVIPDIPIAIYMAYKCWQMERRRNRQAREKEGKTGYTRDPKDFIGAFDFDFPFQLRFTKFAGYSNIKVQNDSVNCLVCCKDPTYAQRYVMVAPNLATSSGFASDLSASSTTLIEGRPLLPALLCMLFTHATTELFASSDGTTYAGVRIGGYEFTFDARFGEQDIILINKIRADLEQLVVNDVFDREALKTRSLNMKRSLLELITKPRKLHEITRNVVSLSIDTSEWQVDDTTQTASADAAWDEDDSNPPVKKDGNGTSSIPNFNVTTGFKKESDRPLSERIKRMGLTDKNLFPRLKPLGLLEHGDEADPLDGVDLVNPGKVENVFDRIASQTLQGFIGATIVCRNCDAVVAPITAVSYFPQSKQEGYKPVFVLKDNEVKGMAFPGMKNNVLCRGGHPVGAIESPDGRQLTLNISSNVRVNYPNGGTAPWDASVWQRLMTRQ